MNKKYSESGSDTQRLNQLDLFYNKMHEGVCLYKLIYNSKGEAIDYEILDMNPAYGKILRIPQREVIGSKASELYGSKKPPHLATYSKVVVTNKQKTIEAFFPSQDKHFTISVFPLGNHKFATVFVDITKYKNAEKKQIDHIDFLKKLVEAKLEESEFDLRSLFNAMEDVVIEFDYKGKYLHIAPTSPDLLYKPDNELLGKTLHEIFPKSQADIFLKMVQKSLEDNKTQVMDYSLLINNKLIWFEGRITPKSKNTALFIAHNITERVKVVESLRKREERFRAISDFTYSWEYWIDPDGKFIYQSPSCERITGYHPEEFLQNPKLLINILHPDDVEVVKKHKHIVFGTGEIEPIEFRIITKKRGRTMD